MMPNPLAAQPAMSHRRLAEVIIALVEKYQGFSPGDSLLDMVERHIRTAFEEGTAAQRAEADIWEVIASSRHALNARVFTHDLEKILAENRMLRRRVDELLIDATKELERRRRAQDADSG